MVHNVPYNQFGELDHEFTKLSVFFYKRTHVRLLVLTPERLGIAVLLTMAW